jgi:O-antigen ligase
VPEIYRAFVLAVLLCLPILLWSESALFPSATRGGGLRLDAAPKYWQAWLILSVLAFFIPMLPIFLIAAAILMIWLTRREPAPMVLFLPLIIAVPPVPFLLSGFGVVESLIQLDLMKVGILAIMVPLALFSPALPKNTPGVAKLWLYGFTAWLLVLAFLSTPFTQFLRYGTEVVLSSIFPFAGARMAVRSLPQLRRFMALFVLACCAAAAIGIFEYFKHWLLYDQLAPTWGVTTWGIYLAREGSLRAKSSLGMPLVLGYVLAIAFVMALSPALYLGKHGRRRLVLVLLAAGLVATISRGPWIGALAGTLVYVLMGKGGARRALLMLGAGAAAFPLLFVIPGGESVLNVLPFVGNSSTDANGTVSYRSDLFASIFPLLLDSPIYGVPDFETRPELQHLRQGDGIIDLVNTYLAVGVGSGLVGVALFSMVHISVVRRLVRLWRRQMGDQRELVRVFVAAYICMLVVIGTVSSVNCIAIVYWVMAGVGSALVAVLERDPVAVTETPSPLPGPAHRPGRRRDAGSAGAPC